jgi:multiple sugar transport system permease protein
MLKEIGKHRIYWQRTVEGYLFIAPWIVGFLAFTAIPLLTSFGIGFTSWSLVGDRKFVGLANYGKMVHDPAFWKSLAVTFYYLVNVPLNLVIGLLLALLMNQKVRFIGFFRMLFYLPSVTASVAVSLLWMWIFNSRFGLLNILLAKVGIAGPLWLGSETWAMPAMVIMSVWGVGGTMLIYLGALQGIPTELYEAATLDGAGSLRKFTSITIPLLTPVILLNFLMGMIGSFQAFSQAFIMTNGGPNRATTFYVLNLYREAFQFYNMGYACALSWVLFMIILAASILVLRLSTSWVHYETV